MRGSPWEIERDNIVTRWILEEWTQWLSETPETSAHESSHKLSTAEGEEIVSDLASPAGKLVRVLPRKRKRGFSNGYLEIALARGFNYRVSDNLIVKERPDGA
jgi:hypothetical protein